jgi:hypothetical protein
MQVDLEKGGRPIVKIPAVLRSIGVGGRARHRQKAIFHARETDMPGIPGNWQAMYREACVAGSSPATND